MARKRVVLFLFIGIFLSGLVSAQVSTVGCAASGYMGKFQKDTNITLTQDCPTCTFLTFTLKDPTGTINVTNVNMTLSNGLFSFGPNHSITGIEGTWFFEGHSNLDLPVKACYVISQTLRDLSTGESIMYLVLIVFFSLLTIGGLYYSITIPFGNDEYKGTVIPTKKKYVKMGFIVLTYALLTLVFNLFFIISLQFVGESAFNAGIELMFRILVIVARPFFVSMFVLAIYHLIKDYDFKTIGRRALKGLDGINGK